MQSAFPHDYQITSDTFPQEIKAFLGTVHVLTSPPQGDTSKVVIVVSDRGTYVVKRVQGEQFSNWLMREYRVLQALREIPLPLPQPYCYVQRCLSGISESWLIMEYLPGDTLRVAAQNEYDQKARRLMLYAVGQALASLHHVPVPLSLIAEKPEPWLDSMLMQARYHLQHYEVDGSAELLEQLERHRPQEVQPTLIHGDFTVDNVLILNGDVSGIVDWAGGAYGDPRYDLALAIRPKEGIFQTSEDIQSFLDGYGTARLSKNEYDYFVSLYEFF